MAAEGRIRTEVHDHVFKIIIDNPTKKNAFSPQMMEQLSDALTELHNNDGYWVRASDYNIFLDEKGIFKLVPHDMNESFAGAQMGPGGGRGGRPGGPGGPGGPDGGPPGGGPPGGGAPGGGAPGGTTPGR